MDPNAALHNILTGHMIYDHVMSLGQWLARQGFAPHEATLPDAEDSADFVNKHCEQHYQNIERTEIRVRANGVGLWTAPPQSSDNWIVMALWVDLLREHRED